ncbi:uncharacterized protein LOC144254151 [Urocitellus parryii]
MPPFSAGSPCFLQEKKGWKEPTGTEKHLKLKRPSNKELEDKHSSQALDRGWQRQTDRTKTSSEGQRLWLRSTGYESERKKRSLVPGRTGRTGRGVFTDLSLEKVEKSR